MKNFSRQTIALFAILALLLAATGFVLSLDLQAPGKSLAGKTIEHSGEEIHILGPTADVSLIDFEVSDQSMLFLSRVDTGAKTCSLHADSWTIEDASDVMEENLGKTIRFQISNRQGDSQWLERTIEEVAVIRTSEREEKRYKIPMTLLVEGIQRTVLVSLNDRSAMSYAMLLGRNFLDGAFLVDVTGADAEDELLARGTRIPPRAGAN
ncbi:MAG: RimK/LysX family protein [Lacipirellulaceae bacterium]